MQWHPSNKTRPGPQPTRALVSLWHVGFTTCDNNPSVCLSLWCYLSKRLRWKYQAVCVNLLTPSESQLCWLESKHLKGQGARDNIDSPVSLSAKQCRRIEPNATATVTSQELDSGDLERSLPSVTWVVTVEFINRNDFEFLIPAVPTLTSLLWFWFSFVRTKHIIICYYFFPCIFCFLTSNFVYIFQYNLCLNKSCIIS